MEFGLDSAKAAARGSVIQEDDVRSATRDQLVQEVPRELVYTTQMPPLAAFKAIASDSNPADQLPR